MLVSNKFQNISQLHKTYIMKALSYVYLAFGLLTLGTIILLFGLNKMGKFSIDKSFWIRFLINNGPLVIIWIASCGIIYWKAGGRSDINKGLLISAQMTANFMPMLLIMFASLGAAMVLISTFTKAIEPFLSGRYGLGGSWIASWIMPGSMGSLPVVNQLWWGSRATRTGLIAFLANSMLVGWQSLVFRSSLLDGKIFRYMIVCNIIYSVIICVVTPMVMKIADFVIAALVALVSMLGWKFH